ncbi:MAG: diacylglycerol/lipid kinase family protein [Thermoanaerobaculia bacterium]
MNALFLINERSGTGRHGDIRTIIRAHWPHDAPEIAGCPPSTDDLDAVIDAAERNGVEIVFAVGGDGTVHEIARRLIGRPIALGIVPTGSGNGFARHLGLSIEPSNMLRSIADARIETIDTAEVNGRPFIGVLGVGFDAFIAERFASSTVRGMRTYIREGLFGFASYRPQRYEITVDGKQRQEDAFVIAVANSSQYGNNARIAPLASLQDGLLDVVIIRDVTLLAVPEMMARLFSGSLHRSRNVTTVQGKEIVLRRDGAGPAHVDGEPLLMSDELRVVIREKTLKVLVPKSAQRI